MSWTGLLVSRLAHPPSVWHVVICHMMCIHLVAMTTDLLWHVCIGGGIVQQYFVLFYTDQIMAHEKLQELRNTHFTSKVQLYITI